VHYLQMAAIVPVTDAKSLLAAITLGLARRSTDARQWFANPALQGRLATHLLMLFQLGINLLQAFVTNGKRRADEIIQSAI
jgi:hypothetical protein